MKNAEFLGPNNGAFLGFKFTGKELHKGGFAGAIWARQTIAPGGQEGRADVLKEDLAAVAHTDVAN